MNFSHFPDLQELGVPLYDLVSCKGTLRVQVLLVIINTIFWKLFIDVTVAYLRPWMEGKPWKDQYLRLFKQTWCKLGIELSDEEWKNCSLMNIPIAVQHVIGGCLCIPSLFPIPGISNEVASILACHGALFETGVEVGDMVTRSYDMAFKKDGFKNNPPMLIVFMFLHHAAGILAVVPFNIYFSDSFLYHEGVFLLQGAAGIGVSCQLYSWTLDLKKKSDLLQMQVISVFTFLLIIYSRVFRYSTLMYETYEQISAKDETLSSLFLVVAVSMGIFNVVLVNDSLSKVKKYCLQSDKESFKQVKAE